MYQGKQDVIGCASEDESINDTALDSSHEYGGEIEEI